MTGDVVQDLRVETVVLGSGPVALAHALFTARTAPVILRCRPPATVPAVESVPAPLLALLLEVGVTPAELDVDHLTTNRLVAWDAPTPIERQSPACAHLDRAALAGALWRRVQACPNIQILQPKPRTPASTTGAEVTGPGWTADRLIDATGRRAITAHRHARPSPVWIATCWTLKRDDLDPTMRLAAGPTGYAYRLGSARWLTVGWVAPGPPPRDAVQLHRRLDEEGAGWLIEGVDFQHGTGSRRVASLDIPFVTRRPDVVAIGDAALARDALASQGTSIGLSDARLAAKRTTLHDLERRRIEGLDRHLRSLTEVLTTCRYHNLPTWSCYRHWLDYQLRMTNSTAAARETPGGFRIRSRPSVLFSG